MKLRQNCARSPQPLYSQEKIDDLTIHLKFFCPWNNWTWFAAEGEPDEEDFRFFGYVCGHEEQWGYFVLSEMEEIRADPEASPSSATSASRPDRSAKS